MYANIFNNILSIAIYSLAKAVFFNLKYLFEELRQNNLKYLFVIKKTFELYLILNSLFDIQCIVKNI